MIHSRVLIASANERVLRSAVTAARELGCEVATATGGPDCLEVLRALKPDLVVLVPPVAWGSEADLLAVLADDPGLPRVPVLVLPRSAVGGAPLAIPVLLAAGRASRKATLEPLVNRVSVWLRGQPAAADS